MVINYWTNKGRVYEKWKDERKVLQLGGLSIFLFDDERSHVVPGFIVVFGVGSVAERELLWLPAAAVHSLGADVLHVEAVHHFGAVFTDAGVYLAFFTAPSTQVMAD